MERIYEKAQREKAAEILQTLLYSVKGLPEGSPKRTEAYMRALEGMTEKVPKEEIRRDIWDFSHEKAQPVFVADKDMLLRPVADGDADFYLKIRMQYSMMYRVMVNMKRHRSESLFLLDLCQPENFFCIIEDTAQKPIGYIGIKDTRANVWELAIELDGQQTHHGYGARSIILFLNEISRVTGETAFQAKVEADNLPSQHCFEKLGAELVGLCNGPLLKTPEEKEHFEEQHLDLIDEHIKEVASRLVVKPRKLLSHVLDYRMTCPL